MNYFKFYLVLLLAFGFSASVVAGGVATDESCEKDYVGIEFFATCEDGKLVVDFPSPAAGSSNKARQSDEMIENSDKARQSDEMIENKGALNGIPERAN